MERAAEINVVAPTQRRSRLQSENAAELPSTNEGIDEAILQVDLQAAADGQVVGGCQHLAERTRVAGEALLRQGVAVVQVRQPVDQLVPDEIVDQRQTVGEPLLQADV